MSIKNRVRKIKHARAVAQALRDNTNAPDYGSLIVAMVNKAAMSPDGGTINPTYIRNYVERVYRVPRQRLPTVQWLTNVIDDVVLGLLYVTQVLFHSQVRVLLEHINGEKYYHIQPYGGYFAVEAA